MSQQKKEFTGVWIPKHIIEDQNLNMTDKFVYAEIACFNVCYKSNEKLGERYGLKADTISRIVAKLKKCGYIESFSFDGRQRQLVALKDNPNPRQHRKIIQCRPGKKSKSAPENNPTIDNNRENKESVSDETHAHLDRPSLIDEEKLIPAKTTYKSKQAIARQKGITLKRIPRTSKQEKSVRALKAITKFRELAMSIHGLTFKGDNNAKIQKMAKEAYDYIDGNYDSYLNWWFDKGGEWCGYKPENVFSNNAVNEYVSINKKSKTYI
jgi:DNA-binding Lrp family transcriptional regulator